MGGKCEKQCSVFGPEFNFVRLQKCHFGVSLRSTGIQVYSLGINTYCLL